MTTFEVTTEIKNPSKILKPGMNAAVKIMVADKKDILTLESESIIDRNGRKMVVPVVDGQPQKPKLVQTGVVGWDTTEIVSGLEDGDEVMIPESNVSDSELSDEMKERMERMSDPASSFSRMQGMGPGGGPPGGGPR